MRLEPKALMCGHPAMAVRDALRYMMNGQWQNPAAVLQERLHLSPNEATSLFEGLKAKGFWQEELWKGRDSSWLVTMEGRRFACASCAPALHRKSAEKAIQDFMDRVRGVNKNERLSLVVQKVEVFGSFLSDAERLSDVDVAVQTRTRFSRRDKDCPQKALEEASRNRKGKFKDWQARFDWPDREVMLILKNRSRAISLHSMWDLDSLKKKGAQSRVIFEEP